MTNRQHSRRGAVMIVVMGLITILLSLALGVTVKVYNGIKNGSNVTQNAQAWIMMQAARMYLYNQTAVWPADAALTIGNIQSSDIPDKMLDDRLGWARIKQIGAATEYYVLANGGGSGENGLKASLPGDGDAVRNAMDIRYAYKVVQTVGPVQTITLQHVDPTFSTGTDLW